MTKKHKIAVLLIFTFALFTRFWHYGDLQFSHDEISALSRTGYSTFAQLIEQGIAIDGHPAGVQTFLHFYTQTFGYKEWVVKLPFTFLGLATLWFIILSGRALSNLQAGLLTAASMAVMQHFVVYSQLARPYGPGLFFGVLAGYFWLRYCYQNYQVKNLWGFMLAAAAAAYCHQFSLLLIALMGLSGFAVLPKTKWRVYFLFNAGIFGLYVPHLPIFFKQLAIGGIGSWLAKPTPGFILQYFTYTAHYSWWFGIILILSLALTWRKKTGPLFWPGLLWFGITFIIGFGYSLGINAVLQFSGLVFSFPFLLLFLFSNSAGAKWKWVLPAILVSGSLSLYIQRQHYPFFYVSPFAKPLEALAAADEKTVLLHNLAPQKIEFYQAQYPVDTNRVFYTTEKPTAKELTLFLAEKQNGPVILAQSENLQRETAHWLAHYLDAPVSQENYFNLTLYRYPAKTDTLKPLWLQKGFTKNSLAQGEEFSTKTKLPLKLPAGFGQETYFLAEFEIEASSSFVRTEMASALYLGDSLIDWETSLLGDFQLGPNFRAFHAFMVKPEFYYQPQLRLELFIYNHDKLPLEVQLKSVAVYPGNPKIYGKFYPF
jgi:hypothetical protein